MCEGGHGTPRRPRTLRYRFVTQVFFDEPARDHALVLRCRPRTGEGLVAREGCVRIEPAASLDSQLDSFGNALTVCRIAEPHDSVRYKSEGVVRIDLRHVGPCVAHPLYRYPSPLASMSDEMIHWLEARGLIVGCLWGADGVSACRKVSELCHDLSETIAYVPGATSIATTAAEAFALRQGVCQDYAHIAVAMLRHLGVAARYVQGLAVGEGSTHAWVQAHLDGRWWGFDPTRDACVDETYLPMAVGRDWSDCPVERGSFVGVPGQSQHVHMEVHELEEDA